MPFVKPQFEETKCTGLATVGQLPPQNTEILSKSEK
jgi:hypothetical protein